MYSAVNPDIEFVALLESDIEVIAEQEAVASSHPWNAAMLGNSLEAGADCGCILRRDQRVGYCVIQQVLDEAGLLNIVIFKPFQGKGLGKQAMRCLQTRLASTGVQRVFLEVRQSNGVARRLYERSGFVQSGIRKAYYRSRIPDQSAEDAVLMVCELSGADF